MRCKQRVNGAGRTRGSVPGPGPPRRMAERGGQHDRNHPQNQAHNEGVHSPIIAEPTPFFSVQCRNFF